jgi:hypothetical protein
MPRERTYELTIEITVLRKGCSQGAKYAHSKGYEFVGAYITPQTLLGG